MATLVTGDKLKHKASGAEYTIISIHPNDDTFLAKRDGDGLEINFFTAHFDKMFEMLEPMLSAGYAGLSDWLNGTKLLPKCECGVDTLGAGLHSNYCPKVGKE